MQQQVIGKVCLSYEPSCPPVGWLVRLAIVRNRNALTKFEGQSLQRFCLREDVYYIFAVSLVCQPDNGKILRIEGDGGDG